MFFGSLQSLLSRNSKKAKRQGRRGTTKPNLFKPVLECLEDRTLLSATLSLNFTQTLVANTNIDVTDNATPSEAAKPTTNESEMVVDINPTNPLNVVGFVHNTSNLNQIQVFFSTNGGANWTRRLITNTTGAGIFNDGFGQGTRFDPALKFDANGTLYLAYGINNSVTGSFNGFTRLVVATSTDGGNTFTRFTGVDFQANIPVANINGVAQPPIVGVDKWQIATGLSGPNSTAQAVYIAYIRFNPPSHTMIAGSRDGGVTFTVPRAVDDSVEHVGSDACPAVGPNGELYVTWQAGPNIYMDRDLDGLWSNNQTFGADVNVRTVNYNYELTPISAQPTRGIANGPVLDVDRSGGVHNGRLYVAYTDSASSLPANANDTDIYLVWSDDHGATWTVQSGRGNVEGGVSTEFLPWVAVDQNTGSVNVAYYTTAGAPDNTQVNLRLASSTNGGVSFQKADVTTRRSQAKSMSYAGQFLEYIGLAVRDGTAQAFWADNRGATQGEFVGDTDAYSASVASRSSYNVLTIKGDGNLNDVIILRNHPLNWNYAEVIVNGKIQWAGLWASIGRVDINGMNGNDTIDIENTVRGVPVTVDGSFGNDTVYISRDAKLLRNIAGDVTIYGDNTDDDQLIINDQSDTVSNPTIAVTGNTVQESRQAGNQSFTTGRIILAGAGFRRGVTINGGSGGNTFVVNDTQTFTTFATTLNTGSGPDIVNVLATVGALTVNGQGGSDNVAIGLNGSLASIGRGVTVTNSGGFSAVSVDDSADKSSRSVILYNNGTHNVISGFPTGGDILLKNGQLSSLAISAGSSVVNGAIVGGNTFRIHDTPNNSTSGGVTTTIHTGAGPDNVIIDGTTGTLDLDVQDSGAGANFISVGSATANLDRINGPINITGLAGAENDLSIIDSASITSHQYVIDRDFVQRGGRARIGYQNMSQLTVRTAAQPDHIIVQDTAPFAIGRSTWIPLSGGNDVIDVLRTTGTLLIDAGGTSAINVGGPTSSLDNIQGVVGLTPIGAGNNVALSLNDQAATTPQQLDVTTNFFGFAALQRSGAAVINVLSKSLYKFSWQSGSGGTNIHQFVRPAQLTNYFLGNDLLTIGTKAGTVSNFGPIAVMGGIGPDAVVLNDSGESRPQTYTVSEASGHEIFTTRGTTVDLGPNIETFEVKGGSGGNIVNVSGTLAGMSTIIHTGAGLNAVTVGGSADSLDAILGPVTLNGAAGTSTLTVNDLGTKTFEEYIFTEDQLARADANVVPDMAPISLSGFVATTLNMGSGGDLVNVFATAAGSPLTVNGQAGSRETFVVHADPNAILGPVIFNGQSADGDFGEYTDSVNTAPHTYTLTSTSVGREDLAPMIFSGLSSGVLLFTPSVGGSTVNVNSVSSDSSYPMYVANGDRVTIGSLAPGLGGTLANILGPVFLQSQTPNDAVTLILDDSGDLTPNNATFTPGSGPLDADRVEGFAASTVFCNLGVNSSVTLLGGQGGQNGLTFDDHGTTTRENYSLTVNQLRRVEAKGFFDDMTPISFTGFQTTTLDVSSGGSTAAVYGSAAGSTVTLNGQAGSRDDFAVDASNNAILGPIFLNGQSAEGDFAQYYDIGNAAPHTYTLTSTSVKRDDQAPVFTNMGSLLYAPMVGGNTFNVTSVALGSAYKIQAANGDHVTVGSLAPGLGGTLADILDQVNVVSYTSTDAVSLIFDDSGNADTAANHIRFSGFDADGNVSMLGLAPGGLSWRLPSTSSVTVLGGAANEVFSMQSVVAVTPLTIVGGTGSNTLDYSSYNTGVSVNLELGTATDLAGIANIQNVIGGSGNDTLTAGADRSILIGGGGADQLFAGSGESILIGGTTDFTQPLVDVAALDAIFQEWSRTDLGFDDRVSDLMTGNNSLGIAAKNVVAGMPILLDSTTVHDDLASNILTGGTGRDWYFIGAGDLITNLKAGDKVT